MIKLRKIILLFVVIACVFGVMYASDFAIADRDLEIENYPTAPGDAGAPGKDTTLPQYIKYLFNFGIGIGGILVFVMFVYAGILWTTSAGNPTAISKAKSKMFGAIAGLALLFLSYIIIVTLNPELAIFKDIPDMGPTDGIYIIGTLTSDNGAEEEKRLYQGDISVFKDNFAPQSVEFISEPDELYSIFAYNKPNFEGDATEIINTGEGSTGNISGKKSIAFFWTRPGVYLYEEPNLKGFRPPKYCSGALNDLDKDMWDNETQSIRFNNIHGNTYGAVLFTDNDFEGKCGYAYEQNVMDLSAGSNNYIHPIGNKSLSSLRVVSIPEEISGTVTVYDSVGCKGRSKTFTPTGVMVFDDLTKENCSIGSCLFDKINANDEEKELNENILSIDIKEDLNVIINNGQNFEGNCQLFSSPKPDITTCVPTLKASNVYNSEPKENEESIKPKSMMIIPAR